MLRLLRPGPATKVRSVRPWVAGSVPSVFHDIATRAGPATPIEIYPRRSGRQTGALTAGASNPLPVSRV
jgi:hypothetical protein